MAEEIHHHTFKEIEPKTNEFIAMIFTIGVGILFVGLLISIIKTLKWKNINFKCLTILAICACAYILFTLGMYWFYYIRLLHMVLSYIIIIIATVFTMYLGSLKSFN